MANNHLPSLPAILLAAVGIVALALSAPLENLAADQQQALQQLKQGLSGKVSEDYMTQDWYLVKWLQAKKFNVPEAQKMLLETVQWRKKNKMDVILKEDHTEMSNMFPVYTGALDKKGRPVLGIQIKSWNIRDAIRTGKQKQVKRYTEFFQERLVQEILELHKAGKSVSTAAIIVDLDGLTKKQHLCPTCVPVLLNLLSGMENHYPGFVDEIIIINAPDTFKGMLGMAKNVMSEQTLNALKIVEAADREKYLMERIDNDQLYEAFGGAKKA